VAGRKRSEIREIEFLHQIHLAAMSSVAGKKRIRTEDVPAALRALDKGAKAAAPSSSAAAGAPRGAAPLAHSSKPSAGAHAAPPKPSTNGVSKGDVPASKHGAKTGAPAPSAHGKPAASSSAAGAAAPAPRATASIDALFAGLADKKAAKKKEIDAEAERARTLAALTAAREAKIARLEAEGRRANRQRGADSPEPLRFDSSIGMNVYSLDALKVGRGGGTPDCPIDCACC
jgi:hypothetical protein